MLLNPESKAFKGDSVFGEWIMKDDLPVFNYTADPRTCDAVVWSPLPHPDTRRNFHYIGNKAVSFLVDNYGTSGMWDELECSRWLTQAHLQNGGTGFTIIEEANGEQWGTDVYRNPEDLNPPRHFAPTGFGVYPSRNGLNVQRDMIMPDGDAPWAFIRVRVTLDEGQAVRTFKLKEEWALKPLYAGLLMPPEEREELAEEVRYDVTLGQTIIAQEIFDDEDFGGETGTEAKMMVEAFDQGFEASSNDEQHPTLAFTKEITLEAGETKEFYFRFGRYDDTQIDAPNFYDQTLAATKARLPKGQADGLPNTSAEIVWNAAAIYGMVFKDKIIGEYTINQGSAYGFDIGCNAAPRDPFQYVSAVAAFDPETALQGLRNTLAWGSEDGDLPFTLSADKEAGMFAFRPSDAGLWALWAAVDYFAMTGDLKSFGEMQNYHPMHEQEPVTLKENLIRHFRFFMDVVGRGAGGHVRIMNADWQDDVLDAGAAYEEDYSKEEMIESGSSVCNTGVAAYVLPRFAGLMEKLGEAEIAAEARKEGAELRAILAKSHNGKFFHRAVMPSGKVIGEDACFMEPQAFALMCGAAEDAGIVDELLAHLDEVNGKDSPLGLRLLAPHNGKGRSSHGGIWYTINEFVTAGAAKCGRVEWAKENHEKMSLRAKAAAYPENWNGVLSGPDAWNAPETKLNPGESWEGWDGENADPDSDVDEAIIEAAKYMSMQAFPVCNTHAHTNPILGLLHIGGVFTDEDCNLVVGTGIEFEAPHWKLNKDGSGWIITDQEITVTSPNGKFTGTGKVEF